LSKALSPGARETFRFGLLQFLYYASIVSFEGFLVPWLRRQGYSPARTGLVMSAIFVFAVFGQPLWGHLCDRIGKHKPVVAGSLLFAAGVALLLPLSVQWFPVILLLALAYSASANSMPGNIDGWIMARRAVVPRIEYGVARGMGSLGFAVAALGLGFLYQRFGLGTMFPAYALIAVAAATVALATPDSASAAHAIPGTEAAVSRPLVQHTPHSLKDAALAVVTHREYRVFAASAVLLFIAFRAAMTFLWRGRFPYRRGPLGRRVLRDTHHAPGGRPCSPLQSRPPGACSHACIHGTDDPLCFSQEPRVAGTSPGAAWAVVWIVHCGICALH